MSQSPRGLQQGTRILKTERCRRSKYGPLRPSKCDVPVGVRHICGIEPIFRDLFSLRKSPYDNIQAVLSHGDFRGSAQRSGAGHQALGRGPDRQPHGCRPWAAHDLRITVSGHFKRQPGRKGVGSSEACTGLEARQGSLGQGFGAQATRIPQGFVSAATERRIEAKPMPLLHFWELSGAFVGSFSGASYKSARRIVPFRAGRPGASVLEHGLPAGSPRCFP